MRISHAWQVWARPDRLVRRAVGLAIVLAAIASIELLQAVGHAPPVLGVWLSLAVMGAACMGGLETGIVGALLSIFYCLHTGGDTGPLRLFANKVIVAEISLLAVTFCLLLQLLPKWREFERREQAARADAEASRLSEQRFGAALRASPILVFNQDRDLRYTWLHSASLNVSGAAVVGRRDADLIQPPEVVQRIEAMKHWVMETGAGLRQEVELQLLGVTRCLDLALEPLRDADGRVIGITGAALDITGVKRAMAALRHSEQALRESEAMLARAQQIANLGSWEIELEPRRVVWSDQMYRIFGLEPRTFTPSFGTILPHVHEQDQQVFGRAFLHTVRNGTVLRMETRIVRPDGQIRVLLVQAERLPPVPGQPIRVVGTVLDMTERKRVERQLQELNDTLERRIAERTAVAEQRAAQLSRLASELTLAEQRERRRLAQVLHDHLQQLLVGAKFGIGILRSQAQEARAETLLGSLAQVNDLLDQSLKLSRSLTVDLSPPILYDAGLSAGLRWLAAWMHENHGLQVDLALDPKAEPHGEDIRVLLFQAARELLFNIVKHAGVTQANLVMGRFNEDRVRIVVADKGEGFDPARLSTRDGRAGCFGLFSIRERLEMMGGWLEVQASPGHGTQVALVAPLAAGLKTARAKLPARPQRRTDGGKGHAPKTKVRGGRVRVLLADDHKIVCEGLASLLRLYPDMEVVGEACNGQVAVDLARRVQPDVVLMDVTMPELNGVEATRQITSELPQVRVIGLSMHTEADMARAMHEAGAVGYLSKSSDPDTVIEAIRACAEPAAAASQA